MGGFQGVYSVCVICMCLRTCVFVCVFVYVCVHLCVFVFVFVFICFLGVHGQRLRLPSFFGSHIGMCVYLSVCVSTPEGINNQCEGINNQWHNMV